MKKSCFLLLFATLCAALSGRAAINEYTINVGDFNNLKVSDNLNVVYICSADSTGFIRFFASPEKADAVIAQNKGGTLHLNVSEDMRENTELPTVYCLSNFLTDVTNSGNGSLIVNNPNRTAIFKASLVGNGSVSVNALDCMKVSASLTTGKGTITLSGKAGEFSAKLVGTGNIDASELATTKANVNAMGTGSVSCCASKNLTIKCIGSTKLYYKPINGLEIKKTGGGKLIRTDEVESTPEQPAKVIIEEETEVETIEIEDVPEEESEQAPVLVF